MRDRPSDRKEVVRVAPKVVSLHLHKNTMDRRKRHELAAALVSAGKMLAQDKDLEGFAVVVIKQGTLETLVNQGGMGEDLFWAKITKELRTLESAGIEEDEDTAG